VHYTTRKLSLPRPPRSFSNPRDLELPLLLLTSSNDPLRLTLAKSSMSDYIVSLSTISESELTAIDTCSAFSHSLVLPIDTITQIVSSLDRAALQSTSLTSKLLRQVAFPFLSKSLRLDSNSAEDHLALASYTSGPGRPKNAPRISRDVARAQRVTLELYRSGRNHIRKLDLSSIKPKQLTEIVVPLLEQIDDQLVDFRINIHSNGQDDLGFLANLPILEFLRVSYDETPSPGQLRPLLSILSAMPRLRHLALEHLVAERANYVEKELQTQVKSAHHATFPGLLLSSALRHLARLDLIRIRSSRQVIRQIGRILVSKSPVEELFVGQFSDGMNSYVNVPILEELLPHLSMTLRTLRLDVTEPSQADVEDNGLLNGLTNNSFSHFTSLQLLHGHNIYSELFGYLVDLKRLVRFRRNR